MCSLVVLANNFQQRIKYVCFLLFYILAAMVRQKHYVFYLALVLKGRFHMVYFIGI